MSMPADVASYAYAWALANIEYIVQSDGMGDIDRILMPDRGGQLHRSCRSRSAARWLR